MADNSNPDAIRESGSELEGPQRLRVLLVNQYFAPSDAPTAKLLADVGAALVEQGNDVMAICSNRGYSDSSVRHSKRDVIRGVSVQRLPGTGFSQKRRRGRVANYLGFFAVLTARLLTIRKPDVVVCLSSPPLLGSIVQTIASIRGIRMVYWVMDVHPELAFRLGQIKKTSLVGRTLDRAARIPLRHAHVVVALGNDMARRVEPYSNGNTKVVHNWADGDRIHPTDSDRHPLRKEWGWDGKFVVAYSGNMGLVHEFDTILDAATRFDGDDRYLFCFIGGGPRCDEVRAEVQKRGLQNVEFRAHVPDDQLAQSLTAPNVHVVSLRSDLAGLSVPSKTYGILAAGKPIAFVGPEESDIASIVSRGGCGFQVDNGDVDGLVDALNEYADSSDRLAAHQRAARSTFDHFYSKDLGLRSVTSLITR
jgi:colanic acid biosynthesis glycosyl transferase WcaI